MRHSMTLTLAALILLHLTSFAAARNPSHEQNRWTPNADTVAKIDAHALQFRLPDGSLPIGTYARYYWGDVEDGHRMIYGHLMSPAWDSFRADKGKIVILSASARIPQLGDGGCDEIKVTYDVETDKVTSIFCDPELLPPPPR